MPRLRRDGANRDDYGGIVRRLHEQADTIPYEVQGMPERDQQRVRVLQAMPGPGGLGVGGVMKTDAKLPLWKEPKD
jgi:hypothetical protein